MNTVKLCGALALVMWISVMLMAVPAMGQRVRLPATPTASAGPAPATSVPPAAPNVAPTNIGPGPTATFNGGIQTPQPNWDPYASPGMQRPLFQQDPNFQFGGPNFDGVKRIQKVIQAVRLDYLYIPRGGADGFGVQDMETNVTMAVPMFRNTFTPLLITPGFAWHLLAGPQSPPMEMPPILYDAYIDAQWNPQVTAWFGAELNFRTGIYSDLKKVSTDSIRYMGKGMAVLAFSPSVRVKAGVWYLDRNKIKLLPAGGVVWTPNDQTRFDILFPNPKIARRLSNFGNTEWWLYARGEYGGGAWTVKRPFDDSVDYNDIKVALGVEWDNARFLDGLFEIGITFDRELVAVSGDFFRPKSMIFCRGGLSY